MDLFSIILVTIFAIFLIVIGIPMIKSHKKHYDYTLEWLNLQNKHFGNIPIYGTYLRYRNEWIKPSSPNETRIIGIIVLILGLVSLFSALWHLFNK